MGKYEFSDLSDEQFENLVVAICKIILGQGTTPFSKGKDGGRDAKFIGTANEYPSKSKPWTGTTIIQAKHTNALNKSYSENDIFRKDGNNDETILGKETKRLINLKNNDELENYLFFSNRKLSGNTESYLRKFISSSVGLPEESIGIIGLENLDLILLQHPEIERIANIDPIDSPLVVSPDDLAEIIESLAEVFDDNIDISENFPEPRTPYKTKNIINGLSVEYAEKLKRDYLRYTASIERFLEDPKNQELLARYTETIDEFDRKIIAKRKEYQSFDDVLNYLFDLLPKRNYHLNRNKRLMRTMVFYMYWNCDIGTDDVKTD